MSAAREVFLERVRKAVAEGNRAGAAQTPLPCQVVGYQGTSDDRVAGFVQAFQAAGGKAHVVADPSVAVAKLRELVQQAKAQRVVLGHGQVLDQLRLDQALRGCVPELWREPLPCPGEEIELDDAKKRLFAADVGITGVDWLIAETGSLVVLSRPGQARSLSLLPPIHIAIAHRDQILPDLFDLFAPDRVAPQPANLTIITGPSKTGDIELKLVTGVHGPGEVHLVLMAS